MHDCRKRRVVLVRVEQALQSQRHLNNFFVGIVFPEGIVVIVKEEGASLWLEVVELDVKYVEINVVFKYSDQFLAYVNPINHNNGQSHHGLERQTASGFEVRTEPDHGEPEERPEDGEHRPDHRHEPLFLVLDTHQRHQIGQDEHKDKWEPLLGLYAVGGEPAVHLVHGEEA